jgi:uncharacterized protein (DUF2141 family)
MTFFDTHRTNRPAIMAALTASLAVVAGSITFAIPSAAAQSGADSSSTASGGQVSVTVTNMRNTKGVVRACMTTNAQRFPRCGDDPASHKLVVPASASLSFTFDNVTPGRYAIALLHDENGNGKADRALMMMPKEGFGFSRDAKVRMGPPKFKDAVFDFTGGSANHSIRMRYLL